MVLECDSRTGASMFYNFCNAVGSVFIVSLLDFGIGNVSVLSMFPF